MLTSKNLPRSTLIIELEEENLDKDDLQGSTNNLEMILKKLPTAKNFRPGETLKNGESLDKKVNWKCFQQFQIPSTSTAQNNPTIKSFLEKQHTMNPRDKTKPLIRKRQIRKVSIA